MLPRFTRFIPTRILAVGVLSSLLAVVLTSSCVTPYYERASDEPGLTYGGGVGARTRFLIASDEDWAYGLGPMASGYLRYHPAGPLSYSGQADIGVAYPSSPSFALWRPALDATLTAGAKLSLGQRAAVKLSAGAVYSRQIFNYLLQDAILPVFDLALLQDFGGRDPVTARISAGSSGLQLGVGFQHSITTGLLARASLGLSLPVPLAYLGFALEAAPGRGDGEDGE
jgi:hypothetical protein